MVFAFGWFHMGMGQSYITRRPQLLVHVSIYQGKPFWVRFFGFLGGIFVAVALWKLKGGRGSGWFPPKLKESHSCESLRVAMKNHLPQMFLQSSPRNITGLITLTVSALKVRQWNRLFPFNPPLG